MNHPYSPIVRTPKAPVAYLAIDVHLIPENLHANLFRWINTFAEQWAHEHAQQLPATLWMKAPWNQSPESDFEFHFACSSKLPPNFLNELADHLSQWIDKALRFSTRALVDANDGWAPLSHWQDGRAWDSNDLNNWQARDQSHARPDALVPSAESSYFAQATKSYSAEEINTRAFKAACESGDKEDLDEYLLANRHILSDHSAYAKGHTPLHLAAAAGDLDTVEALLGYVSPDVLSKRHQTPLIHLADVRGKHSHAEIISRLRSTLHIRDSEGRSALMYAARGAFVTSRRGHITLVKALVNAGADVTETDQDGRTALGWAKKDLAPAKPQANAEVIEYLERQMYEVELVRFFRANYQHHFDTKGVMHIVPRDGALKPSGCQTARSFASSEQ